MSPYRTFAGNGRGTNRPNTGIEANKTVGEGAILRQVGGAFLPHPSAMLSVLSFFMHRQWRDSRAWPESSSRSPQAALVSSGSFSCSKAERLVQPTILASRRGRLWDKLGLALLDGAYNFRSFGRIL
jgi:hypothetical protein